jgi:hypothetical protein
MPLPRYQTKAFLPKDLAKEMKKLCRGQYAEYEFRDMLEILRVACWNLLVNEETIIIPGVVKITQRYYRSKVARRSNYTGTVFNASSITLKAVIPETLKYAFKDRVKDKRKQLQIENKSLYRVKKGEAEVVGVLEGCDLATDDSLESEKLDSFSGLSQNTTTD